jgi:hypothetical protein
LTLSPPDAIRRATNFHSVSEILALNATAQLAATGGSQEWVQFYNGDCGEMSARAEQGWYALLYFFAFGVSAVRDWRSNSGDSHELTLLCSRPVFAPLLEQADITAWFDCSATLATLTGNPALVILMISYCVAVPLLLLNMYAHRASCGVHAAVAHRRCTWTGGRSDDACPLGSCAPRVAG